MNNIYKLNYIETLYKISQDCFWYVIVDGDCVAAKMFFILKSNICSIGWLIPKLNVFTRLSETRLGFFAFLSISVCLYLSVCLYVLYKCSLFSLSIPKPTEQWDSRVSKPKWIVGSS